jgi:hypothetical protein
MNKSKMSGSVKVLSKEGYLVDYKTYKTFNQRKEIINRWHKIYKQNSLYYIVIAPDIIMPEKKSTKGGNVLITSELGWFVDEFDYETNAERDAFVENITSQNQFKKYSVNITPKI